MLVNPKNPNAGAQLKDMQMASFALGQEVSIVKASTTAEIDEAFAVLVERRVSGLLVGADALFSHREEQITTLARQNKIPAIYATTIIGGLMSYGPSFIDGYHQAGIYTGRILKSDKPADLPVQQVTKIELIINMKVARELGIEIPHSLLARADQVIE